MMLTETPLILRALTGEVVEMVDGDVVRSSKLIKNPDSTLACD